MKNIHPFNKIKLAGMLLSVLAIALIVGIKAPDHAKASSNDNMHGWIWSDMPNGSDQTKTSSFYAGRGFGYVSMNSDDPGMTGTYGVSINFLTGELYGQGWSENGGWLDFDAAGPYPPYNAATSAKVQPNCWADASIDVCPVIGWARFTAYNNPQAGGWDGWVNLRSDVAPTYGVSFQKSTGKFSGVAWGGMVVGWLNFDNVTADVNPTITLPLFCKDSTSGQIVPYTDPANIPARCKADLICYKEPGHIPVSYPVGSQIPSQCTLPAGLSVCYSQPGNIPHAYVTGTAVPAVCLTNTTDLCTNKDIPGVQSVLPTFYNGVWYEDPNNDGFCTPMANPPIKGCMNPKANNYNPLATIDDTCTFDGTGGPKDPLNPIYKEN